MTPADRAAAQSALDSGREAYARLDQIRGPEDAAADLVELWGTTEAAMKAMLGGSSLTGQTLVRELRQRGLITLDQANALASFWDARSRVDDVQYYPTLTDIGYGRVGFNQLSDAIANPIQPAIPVPPPPLGQSGATSGSPSIEMPMYEPRHSGVPPVVGRKIPMLLVGGIVLAVLVVAGVIYALFFGQAAYDRQMADAVQLMQTGRVEAARAEFQKISAEHDDRVEPHVFLSRLARNDGDMATARNELVTAIKTDPQNPLPHREMGLLLLANNNPDLAREFLIRAVRLAPHDSAAQGYLGCAMMRLNRVEEAQNFLSRAGPGAWSSCATPATAARPNS